MLHVVELVEEPKLKSRKVIFISFIRPNSVGVIEVRDPLTTIEVLVHVFFFEV